MYDAEKIRSQYDRITNAFSSVKHLKLNYAVKANTNISILKLFKKLNSGIDTVSIQEVQLGLKAGFSPEDIIFTPNGVSLEEIEEVVVSSEWTFAQVCAITDPERIITRIFLLMSRGLELHAVKIPKDLKK